MTRIAIVGAGISGLVAAHVLRRTHDVTVFEAAAYAGGHANTIGVETGAGAYEVDTGFIVHNDRNYPCFEALLAELGVETQPSEMSFSVSDEHGRFEYSGASANGLFANRRHLVSPRFARMVSDLMRFNRDAAGLLDRPDDGISLRDWLALQDYSDGFVERLIVPQASAVWSADPDQLWDFPAHFMAQFFANHGMLGVRDRPRWRTIAGGSKRYVEALTAGWGESLRLRTPVTAIERLADGVDVTPAGGEPERFDEVVIAAHSDQALAMLTDATEREREILGAFPYQRNEAALHTDRSLLPRRRRAWASWNYHLLDEPRGRTTVTYHMNRLQAIDADVELCVTLNRTDAIDPGKLVRVIDYAHPVFTAEGVRAQARHAEISGRGRTHYCGAYWGWGFHEDGVVSGLRVAGAIAARAPEVAV